MTFLSEYDIIPTASHNLLLAHLNCRSIVNTFEELKSYVLMQNFDIIGISETWLKPSILSKVVEIPGYFLIRQDRIHKRGGGVGILIRKGIKHRSLMNQLPQLAGDGLEQLWIEVCLKSHKLIIGVLYKPPHISYTSLSDLDDTLSTLYPIANEIIFMGDLNINLLKPYSDDVVFFNSLLASYNLSQVINEPTRLANGTESLIDVIVTSSGCTPTKTGTVLLPSISDHLLIYCCLETPIEKKTTCKIIYSRDIRNIDVALFDELCNTINWTDIERFDDIDSKGTRASEPPSHVIDEGLDISEEPMASPSSIAPAPQQDPTPTSSG
nr:unnamed protein product [Callosobruchus analis]